MKTYPTIQGDWEIGHDGGKSATKGYFHYTHVYAVSRPEYFHKGWKIPYLYRETEKSATIEENRQPKGTFIVLCRTRFQVPSTFIRGEKFPTITGRLRNRQRSWKIGNERVLSLYSLSDAVSRPEYFHKGWKIPYYKGRLRNRQRSWKIGNQRVFLIVLIRTRFHVPSTFIRGEKCPTITGRLRNRQRSWKIGNERVFSLYSFVRDFTSRVLS